VSFTLAGMDPHEVASILESAFGIAVRAGLHCAPEAHAALGTAPAGTVRARVGPFTTTADIDALVAALGALGAGVP
jgi:selenocysteine lyase/cysteine desulfurase